MTVHPGIADAAVSGAAPNPFQGLIPTDLVGVPEASGLTGLPEHVIRPILTERRIPVFRVGKRIFVSAADLAAYINSRRDEARPIGGE